VLYNQSVYSMYFWTNTCRRLLRHNRKNSLALYQPVARGNVVAIGILKKKDVSGLSGSSSLFPASAPRRTPRL